MAESELGSSPVTDSAVGDVDFVALPPGAKIGRYEVVSVLGQGGFGITYRARDLQLHRDVAIKEYLPTSLAVRQDGITVLPRSTKVAEDFTWGRERFVSEGRTLANLHNATAIVRVFDFLEVNGTAYIVMELVQGETLESLLKRRGTMGPEAIDAIVWPLLDGLAQVHEAGFLHRDIKPANILLGPSGKPTLIDFGASRAAMAGRTTAMTAIFTPGYAAAEQFTSAKQGPWTDIYGLSATIYHAITGKAPASAFDRMLDDHYEPLVKRLPAGFAAGLLIGVDAGLAVRAAERPRSIAGWRPLLSQTGIMDSQATAVLARPAETPVASRPQAIVRPAPAPATTQPSAKSRTGLYAAIAGAVLLAAVGGTYVALSPKASPSVAAHEMKVEELEKVLEARRKADAEAAEKRRLEEEARRKAEMDTAAKRAADADVERAQQQRQKAEEELAKLRAEIEAQRKTAAEQRTIADAEEARRKAEAEMTRLRQVEDDAKRRAASETETKRLADEALARAQAERLKAEADAQARTEEETRRKTDADSKTRAEAETRAKADAQAREKAEAEAKLKAEAENERKAAEAAETALRLGVPERQRVQVALTALGFDTRGSDGALGARSREMITAWQKARNQPATAYLNGTQHQTLLREAALALQKYDDEQKRAEEAKKKAEEDAKQKAATSTPAPAPSSPGPPQAAPAAPGGEFDGPYGGVLVSTSSSTAFTNGPRSATAQIAGTTLNGKWTAPRCGDVAFTLKVSASGEVSGDMALLDVNCGKITSRAKGRVANKQLQLDVSGPGTTLAGTLQLGAAAPVSGSANLPQATPGTPAGAFDGAYGGALTAAGGTAGSYGTLPATALIAGTNVNGTLNALRCGTAAFTLQVLASGEVSGDAAIFDGNCGKIAGRARGQVTNKQLQLTISGSGITLAGTLTLR